MWNKIKNAIYKFMYGRYGIDEFGNFLIRIGLFILIPTIFIRGNLRIILDILFWVITIYAYFRMLSKDVYKRQAENNWFLSKMKYNKTRISQRKTYRFYDCPKCKTHLRVPRGAGKITITCKKCGYQFDKKV